MCVGVFWWVGGGGGGGRVGGVDVLDGGGEVLCGLCLCVLIWGVCLYIYIHVCVYMCVYTYIIRTHIYNIYHI